MDENKHLEISIKITNWILYLNIKRIASADKQFSVRFYKSAGIACFFMIITGKAVHRKQEPMLYVTLFMKVLTLENSGEKSMSSIYYIDKYTLKLVFCDFTILNMIKKYKS